MKSILLTYIAAILIVLSKSQFTIQITKVLSKKVASNGFLILDTDGLIFPLSIKDLPNINNFPLNILNLETNKTEPLDCCFLPFEHICKTQPRIACRTNGMQKGNYKILPSLEGTYVVLNKNILLISPYNLPDIFEITDGKEIYFFDDDDKYETFEYTWTKNMIDFTLFEPLNAENITIYLENQYNSITVTCYPYFTEDEVECPIYADNFPQDKQFQTYEVYIEDSLGNKKKNELVLPININLQYLFK
jgi:hypothetical protein